MLWCECGVCVIGCEVRCLMGNVECLEPTRAFAASHLCDCGIAWRLMVLGGQHCRAGARALRGGGEGGGERWWVCGFVMWLSRLVICAAWRWRDHAKTHSCQCVWAELWSCDGGSWTCTNARCVFTFVRAWDDSRRVCLCCIFASACVQWGADGWDVMLRSA